MSMPEHAAGAVLVSCGLPSRRIAVVTGDDLLDRLLELQEAGCRFEHMDTAEALTDLTKPVICATPILAHARLPRRLLPGRPGHYRPRGRCITRRGACSRALRMGLERLE